MKLSYYWLVLPLILLCQTLIASEPANTNELANQVMLEQCQYPDRQTQPSIKLGRYLKYIVSDDITSIEQLISQTNQLTWQTSSQDIPSLNRSNQFYWLYFDLACQPAQGNRNSDILYLYLDYPLLDFVAVYQQNQLTGELTQIGESSVEQAYYQRKIAHRAFVFALKPFEPQAPQRIYLQLKNDSFMFLPLSLHSKAEFIEKEKTLSLVFGLCLGTLCIIAAFAVFIALSYRELSFVYYALYSLCFFIFYSATKGFAFEYFWPAYGGLSQPLSLIALVAGLGFINIFSILFLQLKERNHLLYKAISVLILACFISATIFVFMPHFYRIQLVIILFSITCVFLVFAGLISLNKTTASKGYLLCLFVIGASALLFILNRFDYVVHNNFTEYSIIFSQFFTFFVLFNVLHDRIRQARKDMLKAQLDATHYYQQFYDIYQFAVEGHYTSTVDGQILHANKAFCELLGITSLADLINNKTNMKDFYVDLNARTQLLAKAKESGQVLNFEALWRTRQQKNIWVSICLRYQDDPDVGEILIGSIIDVSSRKRADAKLEFIAKHDSLTGLLNRHAFELLITEIIKRSKTNQALHSLLYMDLDQFKLVNDTCGHKAGDAMLKQLTSELKMILNKKGHIARLGGDEFGVLLPNCIDEQALEIAQDLKQAVQNFRFSWNEQIFTLGVSIGMITLGQDEYSFEEALSIADTACYAAKEKGRNRIHAYTRTDKDVKDRHDEMHQVGEIKQALEQNRFCLFAQPILAIQSRSDLKHYEVLLRMRDKSDQFISPAQFLSAAERYGLMPQIDQWVIEEYFQFLAQNPHHIEQLAKCAINLSGPSLADENIQSFILKCFEQYQIPYQKICFEITESMAIQQLDATLSFISVFKELGCTFALDDFGSGFSSYGYLKNLPVDYVKIDGSFVKDMLDEPIDQAMVKSINEVAKAIGMNTVAEFVESKQILKVLQSIGVDYAQGYAIAKPKPLIEIFAKP
ncbi:EAL domain-containing protein [Catenovulum sp. 2E275]|uniref:EAL domain-containing protein n=1 Tax=Catenovulum sp. 2E275 TaxID=2980497 RepID=UPI0021D12D9D|nr:EAL domain-containing protein [Catenovulum sp. 2E275]MCU4676316.1 EAL domain-containing protein [Catenovulum sp. 2E275]